MAAPRPNIPKPSTNPRMKPFFDALMRLIRRGVDLFGCAEDPCMVLKHYEEVSINGGFPMKPRQIAWFSKYTRKFKRNGKKTEISHVCGRTNCVVVGHMCCEPHADNENRKITCHKKLKAHIKENHLKGVKVTMEDLGEECPHTPHCYVNAGKR